MYANENLLHRRRTADYPSERDASRHAGAANDLFPTRAASRLLAGGRPTYLLGLLSLLFLSGVALRMMNYEMRRDEQIYVPPARLLDEYRLYLDFFYNHPPGSAWLFHGIRQLTGSDYLLLDARLGVLAAWILLAASVGLVCFALSRSALVSWCITVLFLSNELFLSQVGMTATNNFLPLPFSFLGLGLFIVGVRDGRTRPLLMAMSGLCLSIAAVLKLNAVAFIPPVAVAALLLPSVATFRRRLTQVVAPLLLGGLIGGLPILYYLATDARRFVAHVITYHIGPHAELARIAAFAGEPTVTTLAGKGQLALDVWLAGAMAIEWAALLALLLMTRAWTTIFADSRGGLLVP